MAELLINVVRLDLLWYLQGVMAKTQSGQRKSVHA